MVQSNVNDDPIFWKKKGDGFAESGNEEEAIRCYDKSLEFYPDNGDVWFNKGNSLLALEKYSEAIKCYDKALEINPKDEEVLFNKNLSAQKLKEENSNDFNMPIDNDKKVKNESNAGKSGSKKDKYPAVKKIIENINKTCDFLVALMYIIPILSVISVFLISSFSNVPVFQNLYIVSSLVVSNILIVIILATIRLYLQASGELLQIFVDIEANTRQNK